MAAATSRLTPISGQVGLASPNQKPSATPARAACETVSLKKAIRLAVTNTPRNAQSGARKSVASTARIMNGSVSMVMSVRRDVNAVRLFERLGAHDLLGRTLTTDNPVERVNPGGVPVDHREIVRDKDHRQMTPFLDFGNQIVKGLFPWQIHTRRRLIQQE